MKLFDLITGLIAPRLCEACGRTLVQGEKALCMHCKASLPLSMANRADLRAAKLPRTAPVADVYPWLAYSHANPVCSLIREGKYNGRPELIKALTELFAHDMAACGALQDIDMFVPVPMHLFKRMIRGYNQAAIIAEVLAGHAGVPARNCLRAIRGHRPQAMQTRSQRVVNIAGSMTTTPGADIAGKHIGLVDDIITTGSTLTEAANVLTAAGATSITVFALASAE